jgi:FlaA1/EpsC-like NDP-sugar epimerase
MLSGKTVVVTGGTGSLGQTLVRRLLRGADVVFHAAALKQVPTCEYFPYEAVRSNVLGAENIVRAIRDLRLSVQTVVGISTDKACKPVNVMGMTKALQERILTRANLDAGSTRFVIGRYGNVLASRGSVIPLFHSQIADGGPVTVTAPEMTRFLMSLEQAVDTVFAALLHGQPGEIYVPVVPAAKVVDIASALVGDRDIGIDCTGIRPGEKMHEILVSEEEAPRTVRRGDYFAISSGLPELRGETGGPVVEFRSSDVLLELDEVVDLLRRERLMPEDAPFFAS